MEELRLRMQMLSEEIIINICFLHYNSSTDDLKLHHKISESDRKVNIDVIEASKAANLEEISRLREGNKEFRQKLIVLQKVSA